MDLFTAAGQADLQTVQELLQGGADVDQGSVVHLDVEAFSEELLRCLLCHKEPAPRIQSPLLGALERKKPPTLRSKSPSRGLWMRRAGSLWHKRAGASNNMKIFESSEALDQ